MSAGKEDKKSMANNFQSPSQNQTIYRDLYRSKKGIEIIKNIHKNIFLMI
jgi:hypothetical protein